MGIDNRSFFYAVTIAIGAMNAVIKPAIHSIDHDGFWSASFNLFNVHPVMVGVLLLCIALIYDRRDVHGLSKKDLLAITFTLVGLLIPSATMSWLFIGLFGLYLASRQTITPVQRSGAVILLVAGLREPFMTFLLQVFNSEVLALDATFTALLLSAFQDSVTAQGNMILAGNTVRLVVLTSCSSLANLSFAMLFWFAVSRAISSSISREMLVACGAIVVSMVALNIVRLTMMASSSAQYAIIHESIGKTSFAIIMVTTVSLLTVWGLRNVEKHTDSHRAHIDSGTV